MKKYTVGVVGATGMVGQRFVTLLENHPWVKDVDGELEAVEAEKRQELERYGAGLFDDHGGGGGLNGGE
mgnify:CR=1